MIGATTMTKRAASIWIAAGLLAGLALALALSAMQSARADGHAARGTESIVLSTTEVNFEPGASRSGEEVWIRGSGFTPGMQIDLLVADFQGALYILSNCRWGSDGQCDPARYRDGAGSVWPLIVNDDGAFATKWRLGRFTRANVGAERLATVWAADAERYDFLASAPIALCNLERNADLEEGEDPAEVPDFCSA